LVIVASFSANSVARLENLAREPIGVNIASIGAAAIPTPSALTRRDHMRMPPKGQGVVVHDVHREREMSD